MIPCGLKTPSRHSVRLSGGQVPQANEDTLTSRTSEGTRDHFLVAESKGWTSIWLRLFLYYITTGEFSFENVSVTSFEGSWQLRGRKGDGCSNEYSSENHFTFSNSNLVMRNLNIFSFWLMKSQKANYRAEARTSFQEFFLNTSLCSWGALNSRQR